MEKNLFDHEARIAGMYPIHAIGDAESPPEWVEDFLDGVGPRDYQQILLECPELLPVAEPNDFDRTRDQAAAFAEQWTLHSRTGYLVRAEVCVRRYENRTSFWSGWGLCQLYWLFVPSAEDAIARVIDVASQQHEASKAKAGAA